MLTSKNIHNWSFSNTNTNLSDYIKQSNHTYIKKMLEYNNQPNSKIIMAEKKVKPPPNKHLLFGVMFLSITSTIYYFIH